MGKSRCRYRCIYEYFHFQRRCFFLFSFSILDGEMRTLVWLDGRPFPSSHPQFFAFSSLVSYSDHTALKVGAPGVTSYFSPGLFFLNPIFFISYSISSLRNFRGMCCGYFLYFVDLSVRL